MIRRVRLGTESWGVYIYFKEFRRFNRGIEEEQLKKETEKRYPEQSSQVNVSH